MMGGQWALKGIFIDNLSSSINTIWAGLADGGLIRWLNVGVSVPFSGLGPHVFQVYIGWWLWN
jgi:hypothetical protein